MRLSGFRWRAGALAALLVVAAIGASAQTAGAQSSGWSFFVSQLSAAQQDATGVPGDPGGAATSYIAMNRNTNVVCAYTTWSGIDSPVVFGHIHGGAAGEPENPAILIDLFQGDPINGRTSPASGCTLAAPGLVNLIVRCPKNFSTVLHSQQHPWAAVRGQVGTTCNLP